ncbi:hypothetical protein EW145_g3522 [Phellinidium pouzarii]|uniref:Trafficking protein particle complex subunit n=1 Tax=Phellinidium pouzarii TaxID=167371 RepID=A0A4S4L746_9AGAM|nr:hypothetical protein EW145_g3522 [Phellinidium pouzarii]
MTIYSLYVFDRHCTCVYYHDWHRTKRPKPAVKDALLPAVSRAVSHQVSAIEGTPTPLSTFSSPRNTLISSSGVVVAVNEEAEYTKPPSSGGTQAQPPVQGSALAFDEEAKLACIIIRDENFTSYRTSTYKMHLYETPTLYKFVLLSDPKVEGPSARFALRQMYSGPFLEYVVRNPLVPMDSRERGIDNEYFRASVDRLMKSQAFFN